MKDLISVGYIVADTIDGQEYIGGSATAVALNGAKLGLNTKLLSVVGTDDQSKRFLSHIDSFGVDVSTIHQHPGIQLSRNTISHHDRTSGWEDRGAARAFETTSWEGWDREQYRSIHTGSAHKSAVKRLLPQASKEAIRSFSPGPKVKLDSEYVHPDILKHATHVFLNEHEWQVVQELYGLDSPQSLLAYGPAFLAITRGENGVDAFTGQSSDFQTYHVSATRIEAPETTGAGDALALGVLASILQGQPTKHALELGVALATVCVERAGAEISSASLSNIRR